MNKAQKRLLINLASMIAIVAIFIFAFGNLKNYINKTEAMRAFDQLGKKILEYRKQHGMLPSELVLENFKQEIEGSVRVGNMNYRAQWISIDSPPETIVAYSEKKFSGFVKSGFIVLRLDGRIQYLSAAEFYELLANQQTAAESEEIKRSPKPHNKF